MRQSMVVGCALIALAVGTLPVNAALLYDNGKWLNDPPTNTPTVGTVVGKSYRLPAPASGGGGDFAWPVDWLPDNTFDAAADDFTIDSGVLGSQPNFQLNRIRVYVYESGAANTNNTILGGYLRIWNTAPTGARLGANDGRIAAGYMGTGATSADMLTPMGEVSSDPLGGGAGRSTWTGAYRRGNLADTSTSRPIIALDFDLTGNANFPELSGGTYWLEVSLVGSTGGTQAWVPTEEQKGNRGREISAGNYVDAVGAGTGIVDQLGRTNIRPNIDFAFELYGEATPEPASLVLLAAGGLVLRARRRG